MPTLAGTGDTVVSADGERRLWDESFDVVVAGFGAAGASAAIEASRAGASVLLVDRFAGGGATRMSGGIVYAGGGTELQRRAGYDDSPEEMRKYLELETRGEVSDQALRAFCEQSRPNFEWLCELGAPFPPSGDASKSAYPPDDCTLYFSGNELTAPYRDAAKAAPRGHRPLGKGLTGSVLFAALERAAERSATVRRRCRVRRLVLDQRKAVIGVELASLESMAARAVQALGYQLITYLGAVHRDTARLAARLLERFETRFAVGRFVRARRGVILATGGFAFDETLLERHAPRHAGNSLRLGTASDVGDGIHLATAAGASVAMMERCAAFRFIDPPAALVGGLLLDRRGERVCNEELYGASIGDALARAEHGGRGWLVLDASQVSVARRQLWQQPMSWPVRVFGAVNLYFNYRKAGSLDLLGSRCGMPEGALARAIESYNAGNERGVDAFGKSPSKLAAIAKPPFFAINLDLGNPFFMTPTMTLGGLTTEPLSGRVLGADGAAIPGLYAAGRAAVGICSPSYVSGLSLADCLFSGRNAGADAALRAGDDRITADRPARALSHVGRRTETVAEAV